MKQRISVVVTDLDNTLFDWVGIWHKSFTAMVAQLVTESGISEDVLLSEFKKIHEKHRTSEYAFSIQELPSLQKQFPRQNLVERFKGAVDAYRAARKTALCLYSDVAESLEKLKDKGCLLIGYTESMSFYSHYRVLNLGLDRIIDYLYSPPDHGLPKDMTTAGIRSHPEESYKLRRAVNQHVRKGEGKPDPAVLLDIMRSVGACTSEAIYIGDSVTGR